MKSYVVDIFKDIISEERVLESQRMFISLFYGILNRGLDDATVKICNTEYLFFFLSSLSVNIINLPCVF